MIHLNSLKEAFLFIPQVNGVDLAEVEGGEIAITNMHSCNGPDFVLQLQFSFKKDNMSKYKSPGKWPAFFINNLYIYTIKRLCSYVDLYFVFVIYLYIVLWAVNKIMFQMNADSKTNCKANARLKCVYFPIEQVWRWHLFTLEKKDGFCCIILKAFYLLDTYVCVCVCESVQYLIYS